MAKSKQNHVYKGVLKGSDLKQRKQQIIKEVEKEIGFRVTKDLGESAWWGSDTIGAFHCEGEIDGEKATLKIQGVKPQTSEIEMINSFGNQNESLIVRPPKLLKTIPWDDKRSYEALVMEWIPNNKVVNLPTDLVEVKKFFDIYKEYKNKCVNKPWLERPKQDKDSIIKNKFDNWREISYKLYPEHPFREKGDEKIIDDAVETLTEGYKNVELGFQHGHLSDGDFYYVSEGQIVLLSNLYWSWRAPFYDAIFGQHWFLYHLADSELNEKEVLAQMNLWWEEIDKLPKSAEEERFLKLAYLERAAAGLNLDGLSAKIERPLSEKIVKMTRERVIRLIEGLK
jgi:hypothetical protein